MSAKEPFKKETLSSIYYLLVTVCPSAHLPIWPMLDSVADSSIWNYKSTKHAIFVAGCPAGGRFEMSTAEIIPYPTAGGASALKQENGSSAS